MIDEVPDQAEVSQAVKRIFDLAVGKLGKDILQALIPVNETFYEEGKCLPLHLDAEMKELCGLCKSFHMIPDRHDLTITNLDRVRLTKLRTRIQVFVYCHIMEADYPYVVLLNLLRATKGLP